jgi:hypothetical protein
MQELNESKSVGILYHFVDWRRMDYLIDNNLHFRFKMDDLNINDKYYLSTTRKYNFDWASIRIVLDGTNISSNYEIQPVHFFNKAAMDLYRYKKQNFKDPTKADKPLDLRNVGMKTGIDSKHDLYGNQYEERIMSKYEDNDLSKYILQIDVLDIMGENVYLYLASAMEEYKIPVNFVSKYEPYHKKNKKYVLKHLQTFENYKIL